MRAVLGALLLLWLVFSASPARAADVVTNLVDVHACVPLDDGRVLAASSGGVFDLDASDVVRRVLTSVDGLPDTRASALLVDGDTVWIGTEAGLAGRSFDGLAPRRVFPTSAVRALAAQDGAIYVGTWGDGVLSVARSRDGVEHVPGTAGLRVSALASHGGARYVGTSGGGLLRLDRGAATRVAEATIGNDVFALRDQGARLFVASATGVHALGPRNDVIRVSNADVRAFAEIDGALFGATLGEGLVVIDGAPHGTSVASPATFLRAVGARGAVRCAASATELFIARASRDAGAWKGVSKAPLLSNDVSALAADGDRVFFGTFDRGLAVRRGGSFVALAATTSPADERVNALAVEKNARGDATLWIATARGLTRTDGVHTRRFTAEDGLPSSEVHSVASLPSGGVLVGTARGAALARGDEVIALGEKQGLHVRAVWAVAARGDALWLGTSHGLFIGHGDPRRGRMTWRRLSVAEGSLDDDWLTALVVRDRDAFLGTYAHGVTHLDDLDAAHPRAEHLGGGYVNLGALAVAGDRLFAGTMDGLLERSTSGWRPVGGLPGRDVTAVTVGSDRTLWVGTRSGAARIQLKSNM